MTHNVTVGYKPAFQNASMSILTSAQDQDPDPLDPQDFGFMDPDTQQYGDPWIPIQGVKYQPKTAKATYL